jgi:hypothetical protein
MRAFPGGEMKGMKRSASAAVATLQSIANAYAYVAASSDLKQASGGTGAVSVDGDPVAYWADRSTNARNMTNATGGTTRPFYKTTGGKEWVETDNTDDFLASGSFAIAQPWARVSAIRVLNRVIGSRIFWDQSRSGVNKGHMLQANAGVEYQLLDGSLSGDAGGAGTAPNGSDYIIFEGHIADGAKYIKIYNKAGALLASNLALTAGTNAADGIGIGIGAGTPTNARFYAIGAKTSDFTAGEVTSLLTIMAGYLP